MVLKEHPVHGGNLQSAISTWGIPRSGWLDLSTGIAPFAWPVPPVPAEVWQRLPEQEGRLEQAALQFYGSHGLPVPGSQWAIQQLPALFSKRRVLMARESYEEYRFQWQQQGHAVFFFDDLPNADQLQDQDIVIVINPNNPTAQLHFPQRLLQLANALQEKNGWLIVDEAFMDATPEFSLLPHLHPDQFIVVLRSLGKFFGLAGIRTGFVFGNSRVRTRLQDDLGPWAISHPAQWIATLALADPGWQQQQRQRLHQASADLRQVLGQHFPAESLHATPLFVSVKLPVGNVLHWQAALAQRGIWIRAFEPWRRLRFGVADEAGLQRLTQALDLLPDGTSG